MVVRLWRRGWPPRRFTKIYLIQIFINIHINFLAVNGKELLLHVLLLLNRKF